MKSLTAFILLLAALPAHAFDWAVAVFSHNVNKPPYKHGWAKLEHTRSNLPGSTSLSGPSGWSCHLEVDPTNQIASTLQQLATVVCVQGKNKVSTFAKSSTTGNQMHDGSAELTIEAEDAVFSFFLASCNGPTTQIDTACTAEDTATKW